MANAKYVSRKSGGESKTYNITLRRVDVGWLLAGGLLLLSIFFLFGVLVGRGWRVEEPLELLQTEESGQVEAQAVEPEPKVLKAEDLTYQQSLSQPEPKPVEPGQVEPLTVEPAPEPVAQPEPAPEVVEEAAEEADPTALPAPEPGEKVYAYVFQAASYRTVDRAEELRAKIEEAGLSARVTEASIKGEQWHRVQVTMDLSPSQAVEVIERVRGLTGEKPVRISKKLVE